MAKKPNAQLDLLRAYTPHPLSKSKFLSGAQCPKLLWHQLHRPDMIPPPSTQTRALFKQGSKVGELARTLFPDGILLSMRRDPFDSLEQTRIALAEGKPVFEAGATFQGGFAYCDILKPLEEGGFVMIEVKSSTSVKKVHLKDVAFQRYVFKGAGIDVRKTEIWHIDRSITYREPFDVATLFSKRDVTKQAEAMADDIAEELAQLAQIGSEKESPEIRIGEQCFRPYECPLFSHCWKFLPENPVIHLTRGRDKALELMEQGVLSLKDIPEDTELTDKQRIQVSAVKSGKAHVVPEKIASFLDKLTYPLHYFDLESYQVALPPFEGLSPYEQIPFQFSLHIEAKHQAPLLHRFYLHEENSDPRVSFAEALRNSMSEEGSIVVFNAQFEWQRLDELANHFPQFRSWVQTLKPRLVDLHKPFANYHYYHPSQIGSTSMKKLLPLFTPRSYQDLDIQEGHAASVAYQKLIAPNTSKNEKEMLKSQLLTYCGEDTLGMVAVIHGLFDLARS